MATRKIRGWWNVDLYWNGVRYRKRSPLNTRMGAEQYEIQLRQELLSKGSLDHLDPTRAEKPLTFGEFAEKWFLTYAATNNKASTSRSKRSTLDQHLLPVFGKLPVASISTDGIEIFKAKQLERGLCAKTINNQLSVLRTCLSEALERGHIVALPRVKRLRVPPPETDFLSAEEAGRLLVAAGGPFWREMILCGLRTGMRLGELCALHWKDVHLESRVIKVQQSVVEGKLDSPKNNRVRLLPIAPDLYEVLSNRTSKQGFVFAHPEGGHFGRSSWPWKALTRACTRAGLRRIGWHTLRHTFASQLVAAGIPIRTVQVMLGHSTVQMTERYAHVAPSAFSAAIERLAMFAPLDLGHLMGTASASTAFNTSIVHQQNSRNPAPALAKTAA